jgi:hypothetical protein
MAIGSLSERSTVEAKETFPCSLAAESAGVREGEFREVE